MTLFVLANSDNTVVLSMHTSLADAEKALTDEEKTTERYRTKYFLKIFDASTLISEHAKFRNQAVQAARTLLNSLSDN